MSDKEDRIGADNDAAQGAGPVLSSRVGHQLVYLVPSQDAVSDEVDLLTLAKTLWAGKWLIATVAAAFTAAAASYAFTATEWYRAEVLLLPVKENQAQGLMGRLGGLGDLVGLSGIDIESEEGVEALATLRSRDFSRDFIEDHNLVSVLLHDEWNAEKGEWKADDPEDQPDIRDAVKFFIEDVRVVSEDRDTGLVTLSIDWTDPGIAASWASELVSRLNENMRQRALREAEHNTRYLRDQLEATNVSALRESVAILLETELQKLMLAKGTEEFSFRVIDSPHTAKEPVRPKRVLIILLGALLGGLVGILVVFIRGASDGESGKRDASAS